MPIRDLSQRNIAVGDLLPFLSSANGADSKTSLAQLVEVIQTLLTAPGAFMTQYAAPNASAFNIAIDPATDGESVYLLLTPTAGFAAGTITLPAQAECHDGQEVLCNCTQLVTALTVAGNGSTVNGAPTTLAANAFFRLRFDGTVKAWYRIG